MRDFGVIYPAHEYSHPFPYHVIGCPLCEARDMPQIVQSTGTNSDATNEERP